MNKLLIKQEADALIDELPEETSWDELMYKIYVRQKIEHGLKDIESENIHKTEDIEKHFNLKKS